MPVGSAGDRRRDQGSCSVNGLPDIASIDTTSDLLDEDRSETLCPEALVYAEEVDLSTHDLTSIELHRHWNARDATV